MYIARPLIMVTVAKYLLYMYVYPRGNNGMAYEASGANK
jgi:hypothetical protein